MTISLHKLILSFNFIFLLAVLFIPTRGYTQGEEEKQLTPDSLITIARQIINATQYCALITTDDDGNLHARTMEPFSPEEDMVIWFGTNPKSRKVKHIQNNPQVLLYYFNTEGTSYVTISGLAQLINDPELKIQYWKEEWEQFYPNRNENYLLIKVIPQKLDVFSFKDGAIGDPETWQIPSVDFDNPDQRIKSKNINIKGGKKMEILSTVFDNGAMIPRKYTCDDVDISPPLKWSSIPEGTKTFALICDDPDAPMGTWVHWVIFNLPGTINELPENVPKMEVLANGAKQGKNDFGKIGYGGPCPPGGTHRYYFKIYALDVELPDKSGITKSELLKAMEGHILSESQLMGTYRR